MEKYKNAKKLYSDNKFESAMECFKDSFNTEVLNENEKIDCLSQIVKIQKLLNKREDSEKVERDLAEFLIQKKEYSTAAQVLSNLVNKKRTYETSFRYIETLILVGSLEAAEKESIELFKYLYRKKNFKKTQQLYERVKLDLPENAKFDSFLLLSYISQGDFESIEKIEVIEDKDVLFESLINVPFNHWRHSSKYFNTILNNAQTSSDYLLNKKTIKLLMEVLLLGKKLTTGEANLALLSFLQRNRKTASRLLCNYAEETQLNLNDTLMNKIDSLPEDDVIETDYDLGEDLLENVNKGATEIEELVNNIKTLEAMGELEEAQLLKKKLKKMDPTNELVAEAVPGSKIKVKRIEASDLQEQWDSVFKDEKVEIDSLAEKARSSIVALRDDEVLKNYKDLIVCFNTMNLYEASLLIIKRVEGVLSEEELMSDIEFGYLKIRTLYYDQNYYEAYDLVTSINGTIPMPEYKRIEFLYLQGEIARKLGRTKDAIKSYQLVRSINPKYRLVEQRLQSFG